MAKFPVGSVWLYIYDEDYWTVAGEDEADFRDGNFMPPLWQRRLTNTIVTIVKSRHFGSGETIMVKFRNGKRGSVMWEELYEVRG